ncbi:MULTISPECIES: DUF5994 family protein [Nocardia]|uniref:DUF5994 family protein n=1 Tax=Nocardia TaxID=1817 RepID=UPI00082F5F67|nr:MULTISPECIES: DUF5994 family protein [Nocardia]UFS95301.1 DUF5994 family protein [Nocardia huaxiensis]
MTSQPNRTNPSRQASPTHQLRLELDASGTGTADGFWWPHSRDLATELPDLLAMLTPRLGPIHRVIYHLDEWATAPRKLDFGGRRVRLDGYRHMAARTLEVLGVGFDTHLTLQIITPLADTEMAAAQQRWDSEGGAGANVRFSQRNMQHERTIAG